jgi:ornithine cyclodeaminase
LKYFDQREIEQLLDYPLLIGHLEKAFRDPCEVPPRLHYDYKGANGTLDSTLLLMPAWRNEHFVGLKVLTISPYNSEINKPTIQGVYILMDAKDGEILAQFDAKSLTNLRTAASSALASSYLSKRDSNSMLMMGTGALAPELIKAHCAIRPIELVWIWGRNLEKAQRIAENLKDQPFETVVCDKKDDCISKVDIISTATSSSEPLVLGNQMVPGQHLDLVGAFKPTWREADEEAIINSSVFVDTREGTLKESGELLIPMGKGLFSPKDIQADLFDLCQGKHFGRKNQDQKTVFISVGYALEDLAAAELVWSKYQISSK